LPKPLIPIDVDLEPFGVHRRTPGEDVPERVGLFHA
jgi:hypothetical protein